MGDHVVWTGNGHTIIYSPYLYEKIGPEQLWNDMKVHAFFAAHWHVSIYLAIGYVILINVLQKFMENRKPLSMRTILFAWNGLLAVFSIIGTWRFGVEFVHMLTERPLIDSLCFSVDPNGPAAFWAFAFAMSKIAEFGDTLFLVLRKREVIFLHWYHHAVVLILSWHSAVELTAAGRYFILMNYFVHSIMYTYYMITSLGYRLPKIVSMSVTFLQTAQMLIGVCISVAVLGLKLNGRVCQQSYENIAISFAIYASFLLLFSSFFIKAYFTGKPKKSEAVAGRKLHDSKDKAE